VQKSEILPIQCGAIDISAVLGDFQARQGQFLTKYLGLPLQLGRLTRTEEQNLFDRVAAHLPGWKGRLLSKIGRLALVNFVLSLVVIYHMSIFQLSKWAIKQIDKICRSFLWKGAEEGAWGALHGQLEEIAETKTTGRP
jgi:hypothetical protein